MQSRVTHSPCDRTDRSIKQVGACARPTWYDRIDRPQTGHARTGGRSRGPPAGGRRRCRGSSARRSSRRGPAPSPAAATTWGGGAGGSCRVGGGGGWVRMIGGLSMTRQGQAGQGRAGRDRAGRASRWWVAGYSLLHDGAHHLVDDVVPLGLGPVLQALLHHAARTYAGAGVGACVRFDGWM